MRRYPPFLSVFAFRLLLSLLEGNTERSRPVGLDASPRPIGLTEAAGAGEFSHAQRRRSAARVLATNSRKTGNDSGSRLGLTRLLTACWPTVFLVCSATEAEPRAQRC